MAVIKRGILGGISGKIANVVGGSWKGIAYVRSLPLSVANPNTAAQQAQRGAFSQIVIVAKILLASIIKPLNDRFAQYMSGYNRFVRMSIDAFNASGLVTFADFKISEGALTAVTSIGFTMSAASKNVTCTWTDNSGTGTATASDESYFVVHNETQETWAFVGGVASRNAESTMATFVDDNITNDVMHGYLAFRRDDGTLASNTVYGTDTV